MKRIPVAIIIFLFLLIPASAMAGSFTLTSKAFKNGDKIPPMFTCDGREVSPALEWSGAPKGTKFFTLIMDDPDAPGKTWVHWVLFNIPGDKTKLFSGIRGTTRRPDESFHGMNSWVKLGYGGPCPPGGTHRYFFKLYAMDAKVDLQPGASVQQVMDAMEGHVLGTAELMGKYR